MRVGGLPPSSGGSLVLRHSLIVKHEKKKQIPSCSDHGRMTLILSKGDFLPEGVKQATNARHLLTSPHRIYSQDIWRLICDKRVVVQKIPHVPTGMSERLNIRLWHEYTTEVQFVRSARHPSVVSEFQQKFQ